MGPYQSLADAERRESLSGSLYVTNLRVDFQKSSAVLSRWEKWAAGMSSTSAAN